MGDSEFRLPRAGAVDDPVRLAVLISGSGSGMRALLLHQQDSPCSHRTVLVISNKAGAEGLSRAHLRGVPTATIELPSGMVGAERRLQHESLIRAELEAHRVELVVLSGYMRVLSPGFVEAWNGRLLNIHPSLLPAFPGSHAHEEVLAAGVTESGCTVHFVDAGVDSGLIIAQRGVPVHSGDTLGELQERVRAEEHVLYPHVIDAVCEGRLAITKDGVDII